MKLIKPIVGISKIVEEYDIVISGFGGVLSKGEGLNSEALEALKKCAALGKKVVVLTNSALRLQDLLDVFIKAGEKPDFLTGMVSAGELLHYELKNQALQKTLGKKYYNLGNGDLNKIMAHPPYEQVTDLVLADFLALSGLKNPADRVEMYRPILEHACGLDLPLLCVGNDVSIFENGQICYGGGILAEQYAVLGGRILSFGKPDPKILNYALEEFAPTQKVLIIGDSFTTDMKAGTVIGADTLLISKGIHVNILGEGYIPDIEKVRETASHFGNYPDYVISGLRW